MNIIIAGGGNIGYYLARIFTERKYRVSVIERDQKSCDRLNNSSFGNRIVIIMGDATDEQIQRDAGTAGCDAFIAATGQDQNNLTACMVAKQILRAKRTVTRVNNPKNIPIFEQLGIDSVISSTGRIAGIIEQELEWSDIDLILSQKTEDTHIRQFIVNEGAAADGAAIAALKLPAETIIVVVVRGNHAFIPNGDFRLSAGDELMMMGSGGRLDAVKHIFIAEGAV